MRIAASFLLACLSLAAQGSDPASDLINKGCLALRSDDSIGAIGAWLRASRLSETRIAEIARNSLPLRYPYASEFRAALVLDPKHAGLRKDLACLLLELEWVDEAIAEFETLVRDHPEDLQAAAQLAYLYIQSGRQEEAAKLLEEVASPPQPSGEAIVGPLGSDWEMARSHRELA